MEFNVGDCVKVINYMKWMFDSEPHIIGKKEKEFEKIYYELLGFEDLWLTEDQLELIKTKEELQNQLKSFDELVYQELQNHIGIKNAIHADELAEIILDNFEGAENDCATLALGEDPERKIRFIIQRLRRRKDLELVIGSCTRGYYVCTKDDVQTAIDRMLNTAKSEFKTAQIMAKKAGLNGQMKISFDGFCKDIYKSLLEE